VHIEQLALWLALAEGWEQALAFNFILPPLEASIFSSKSYQLHVPFLDGIPEKLSMEVNLLE